MKSKKEWLISSRQCKTILKAAAAMTILSELSEHVTLMSTLICSYFFNDMKFFTIIVFKLQICFKCVSFSSHETEIVKTFHVEFSFWIPEFFFCIFQPEATDNGTPVILSLF